MFLNIYIFNPVELTEFSFIEVKTTYQKLPLFV